MKCDGACERHRGEVRAVVVRDRTGWNEWDYCEAAVETDQRNGFRVYVLARPSGADGSGDAD